MERRSFLIAGSGLLAAGISNRPVPANDARRTFEILEKKSGGRLGVYALDSTTGRTLAHRAGERFPMCSTFKVLAVAAVLRRIDAGSERLDREIAYGQNDLQAYGPATRANVARGRMTVRDLCKAAIELSDNTAANLLLRSLGGPSAVTAFVRETLRDPLTRLDRNEPTLNTAIEGDVRDTTTPQHMVGNLEALLPKNTTSLDGTMALSPPSSRMLEGWMHDCQTGVDALRAAVPATWAAGDKTGSGDNGTRNDIAIFRPPHRGAIFIASYLTGAGRIGQDARNATLAAVGRVVVATFG